MSALHELHETDNATLCQSDVYLRQLLKVYTNNSETITVTVLSATLKRLAFLRYTEVFQVEV